MTQRIRPLLSGLGTGSLPPLTRSLYARELPVWALLPLMTGAIEGGVVGVIVKKVYAGVIEEDLLNLLVAFLVGLQAITNLTSFAWASLAHGRSKTKMLLWMQIGCAVTMTLPAFASETPGGLVLFMLGIVGSRLCWSGVVTLRSTVWAANYPRHARARIAGRFAAVQALVLAGVSAGIGVLMDIDHTAYRWAYPTAAGIGLLGAAAFSRVRMRGERAMLKEERASDHRDDRRPSLNPIRIIHFLRSDRTFGTYMVCQFMLGIGNMMISAPLIIVLTDVYGMDYVQAIALLTSIPIAMMPFVIPMWSRLFDRIHVVRFRSIHSWIFVITNIMLIVTVATGWMPGFWIAAAMRGVAYGGGVLAWNLGHHDFSSVSASPAYMGVHVTLTGFRGLIAPTLGVLLYEAFQGPDPNGVITFSVSLLLGTLGALGFVWMANRLPNKGLLDQKR